MDTEISSVNTSFVGVVFPVLPASPIKRVINARKVPPLCQEHLRKMKSEKEHNEKRRVP